MVVAMFSGSHGDQGLPWQQAHSSQQDTMPWGQSGCGICPRLSRKCRFLCLKHRTKIPCDFIIMVVTFFPT